MPDQVGTTSHALYCPNCMYDLQGLAAAPNGQTTCPECGHTFTATLLAESTIPWSHRQNLGRRRALTRTASLVVFHPRKFASQLAAPVSLADALAFRRAIVLLNLAAVSLLFVCDYAYRLLFIRSFRTVEFFASVASAIEGDSGLQRFESLYNNLFGLFLILPEPLGVILFLIGFGVTLLFITGVHTYFFHPRTLPVVLQNRALALSYYAAAPLRWGPLALCLAIGGFIALPFLLNNLPWPSRLITLPIVFGPLFLCVLIFWLDCLLLLRHTTHCSTTRMVVYACVWPMLWFFCVAIAMGLPLVFGILLTAMMQTM